MKHPLHALPHFAGARFFILLLGRNMIYLPNDKKARVFLAACNNAKIYTDVLYGVHPFAHAYQGVPY